MKYILSTLLLFFTCLITIGCHDNDVINSEPDPEQNLTCKIFMPEDGSVVNMNKKLVIRGEGITNYGKIISAELKVGGITISDISSVPFYYEYAFKKGTQPGELKIELQVIGDREATASTSITVYMIANK